MRNRPIIFVNTDNYPVFCDNRCVNTECGRHISKLYQHSRGVKISRLKDTEDCEGYISKRKKAIQEIKQIEKEMEAAGVEK